MRSIHAAILGSAMLGTASIAAAQPAGSNAASKLPPINYTRSQTFKLPVVMDKNDRQSLSEIRLYVKTPSTGWTMQDRGNSELTQFSCNVSQDGEYWYTLALVDRGGRMNPADPNLEAPSQRVVVDTTAPVIQVSGASDNGDFCLRCTVQDQHADFATLKAVCRTDVGEVPLEIVPNQPGMFRLRNADMMRFPVTVSVRDLAGNVGTKEVNLREMVSAMLPAPKSGGPIAPTEGSKVLPPPRSDILPPPPLGPLPPPRDIFKTEGTEGTAQKINFGPTVPPVGSLPPPVSGIVDPINKAVETPGQSSGPLHLINTSKASVEYRIEQVGPSGLGKVEIWMTPDKGQSWHRLLEHIAKKSPADIELPGDGVYGIRVVVANGNGFGGKAPLKGDAPHYTIEVDTTAPFVQLRSADVLPSAGLVELRWNATDKNLGSEPVSLFYRTSADGPWQVIAKGIKNDGAYRWAFPRDGAAQIFFKIEVTDRAGNTAQAATGQPVLIDMTEPRVTVTGVTGSPVSTRP
jgi:hypothetical protein